MLSFRVMIPTPVFQIRTHIFSRGAKPTRVQALSRGHK
jgi:hypothetical protein